MVTGDGALIGAGALVQAMTQLPEGARVGMRHIAAPTEEGFVSTADVEAAREASDAVGFFDQTFGVHERDQAAVRERAMAAPLAEVRGWRGEPQGAPAVRREGPR